MCKPKVDVLLSTYNGATYLQELLHSILTQTFEEFRLVVRDDGSSDGTRAILAAAIERDRRITLVDSRGNLGPSGSFVELLGSVQAPFFMFCDQDDIWLPPKIELTLQKLQEWPADPHLVFSDLVVVDKRLGQICPSFMQFQRFDPLGGTRLERLLMQNVVVGCTVGGNSALLKISRLTEKRPPKSMAMHDWWLALVARAFGQVSYIEEPTIMYRQHPSNTLGAPGSNIYRYLHMLKNGNPWRHAQSYLALVAYQAEAFGAFYEGGLSLSQKRLIGKVSRLHSGCLGMALLRAFAEGAGMNALDRNLALFLSCLPGRLDECWKHEQTQDC